MNIVAFRHMVADDLGSFAAAFDVAGLSFRYIDTYFDDWSGFDPCEPDLLVVLGGSAGAYQTNDYPFLKDEINAIEKRLAKGLPVLGSCLGAQLIAKALGANVYPGSNGKEKGWYPLTLTEEGKQTAVRHFDGSLTSMLHWHGDTFDLPQGAVRLASSALYENQIFSWGDNVMALQCHAEITPFMLHGWMVSSAPDVMVGCLDLDRVRGDTAKYGEKLVEQAGKFLLEWLDTIKQDKDVLSREKNHA